MLNCTGIIAQNLSKLGDISKEDIELTQCLFDMEANAVILLHEAFSDHGSEYELITLHHIRIKILKESGLGAANISIPFYRKNDFERIDKVEGITINTGPGGEIVKQKLEKKSIYKDNASEEIGEVIFAFPAVKTGSIIEYKYRSIMKHYGGLDEWKFQDKMPVVSSKYMLTLLPNTEFAYRVNLQSDRKVVITPYPGKGRIYFEMSNIPGLQNEPYMDARKDYIQKVIFQLSGYNRGGFNKKEFMTSWDAVNRELLSASEFGEQLKKNIDAADLINLVKLCTTPENKMKTVYSYVRTNMKWNGVYSKFSAEGIKNAWKRKSGTSGDINLLLVNLLNEAGLDTYAMLVSERFNGKVNTDYPFIDQFNSVFACVKINEKNYYLDATDNFSPTHITPYNILNTKAFIVSNKSGEIVQIENDSLLFKENSTCFMEIKEDGTVKGSLVVQSEDYARVQKLESYEKDRPNFKNNYFSGENMAHNISGFEINNLENDSLPLEQKIEFNTTLKSSGDYLYISPNFLPDFKNNPFLNDNRFSNINFGYRKNVSYIANILLADEYVVDNIPKPVTMITPGNDILFNRKFIYNKEKNTITCTINIEFKKSLYSADEYQLLQEVYKRLFDYLHEPVLLKKK